MNEERVALRQRRDLSEIIQAAITLYMQNFQPLFLIATLAIPLGIASAVAVDSASDPDATTALLALFLVAQFIVDMIVIAALIVALQRIDEGETPDFGQAYDAAFARIVTLFGSTLRATFHVLLLAITIIGIPWAFQRTVRWFFIEQAVMLDGVDAKQSLSTSAAAVEGSWWRTLGVVIVVSAIAAVPGFAVSGMLFLAPVLVSGTIGAAVAAIMLPFRTTALTMLYMDLKARKEIDDNVSPA